MLGITYFEFTPGGGLESRPGVPFFFLGLRFIVFEFTPWGSVSFFPFVGLRFL